MRVGAVEKYFYLIFLQLGPDLPLEEMIHYVNMILSYNIVAGDSSGEGETLKWSLVLSAHCQSSFYKVQIQYIYNQVWNKVKLKRIRSKNSFYVCTFDGTCLLLWNNLDHQWSIDEEQLRLSQDQHFYQDNITDYQS